MTLTLPVYCAICAAPCHIPRTDIPHPSPNTSLLGTDTVDHIPAEHPVAFGVGDWLHEWHCIAVSSGLLDPCAVTISSVPVSDSTPKALRFLDISKRMILMHDYCLKAVFRMIRRSMFNNGYSHEESMMIGWSLPKWTGWGPWVPGAGRDDFLRAVGTRVGLWRGTASQRARWQNGQEGSHLFDVDYVSPETIGMPKSAQLPGVDRPVKKGAFLLLPHHVHLSILFHLLDNPELHPKPEQGSISSRQLKLLRQEGVNDFLSLLRTCSDLRYMCLPAALWKMLLLNSVSSFKLDLMRRWRANPTGVGSASQLWIALDEEFVEPVERVIAGVRSKKLASALIESEDKDQSSSGYEMRDVWEWWTYGEGWRSRRRVWYCVVHGCATARDADWW